MLHCATDRMERDASVPVLLNGGTREALAACQKTCCSRRMGFSLMYDMLLAFLFFLVVLSPLVINAWLNMAERRALRFNAKDQAKSKGPQLVWASDPAPPTVSSAAQSAR